MHRADRSSRWMQDHLSREQSGPPSLSQAVLPDGAEVFAGDPAATESFSAGSSFLQSVLARLATSPNGPYCSSPQVRTKSARAAAQGAAESPTSRSGTAIKAIED